MPPEGNITSFIYDEGTMKLQMVGLNLPSVVENITKIEFALATCTLDESTQSDVLVECTLDKAPTCGDFKPVLISSIGIMPVLPEVANQTILCSVASAHPTAGLNLLGGDNITISGQFLPHTLDTSTVSV
jgi:hypothetical protein